MVWVWHVPSALTAACLIPDVLVTSARLRAVRYFCHPLANVAQDREGQVRASGWVDAPMSAVGRAVTPALVACRWNY